MTRRRTPKVANTFPADLESLKRGVQEIQRWITDATSFLDFIAGRVSYLEGKDSVAEGQLRTDGSGGYTLVGINVDPLRVTLQASPSKVYIPFKVPLTTDNYLVLVTKANGTVAERIALDTNTNVTREGFWVAVTTHNVSDFNPNTNAVGFNFKVYPTPVELD